MFGSLEGREGKGSGWRESRGDGVESSYHFLCFDVSINNRVWTRNLLVDEISQKWKNRIGIPPFVWLQGEKGIEL